MAKAFVFINVNAGFLEAEVVKKLRELPEVREAYVVYGAYDVVARIETDSGASQRNTHMENPQTR